MVRIAVCAGLAAALLAAADSAAAPALRVMRTNPVAVKATGFHARESVRITVKAGRRVTRSTTRADDHGRFAATVPGAVASACVSLAVTATGSDGSHAAYRRGALCTTHGGG